MTIQPPRTPTLPLQLVEVDDHQPDGVARAISALIVGVPFVALIAGLVGAWRWGWGLHVRDVLLAAVLYFATGHGIPGDIDALDGPPS